jgi:hypothetical protein
MDAERDRYGWAEYGCLAAVVAWNLLFWAGVVWGWFWVADLIAGD